MDRRNFLKTSFALYGAFATKALADSRLFAGGDSQKPNIVFLLIDDMGWKDLGCFGAELYETPNINKLCSEGMRFPQAYTSTAICSPARATALTGMHPMKLHMWNHHHSIPKGQKILPQYLKENGYQTWHVGKWHMGNPEDKTMPTDLGFDINRGGWKSWSPGSYFWPYGCDENGLPINERTSVPGLFKGGKEGEYLTDRLTDEALKLLEERDSTKPFYLNFWHYAVHNPKEAKPELLKKYEEKINKLGLKPTYRLDPKTGSKLVTSETNAVYAAMIESVDQSVGRLVKKLKEIGEYDNTLFVFYSDNGSTTNDVPCAPLNGGKNSTYEAGERVPAFVTWKNHIKAGTQYKTPVYLADVFNTILATADVSLPANYDGDGKSLMPVFAGKRLPQREFIWYFPDTRERWAQRANAAIYDEKSGMKYIMFFNGDEDEMYNIDLDLPEANNVIEQNPELAKTLNKRLVTFLKKYYPQMPPPPEIYEPKVKERLMN